MLSQVRPQTFAVLLTSPSRTEVYIYASQSSLCDSNSLMCIPWWGALSILPFWCDIQKNIWYVTFRAERFDAQVLIFKFLQSCRKLSERLSNGAKSREWAKLYSGCLRKYTTWERRGKRMPKTTGKTCYLTKGIKFSSNYMRSYKHKTRSRKRPSSADDHTTTRSAHLTWLEINGIPV